MKRLIFLLIIIVSILGCQKVFKEDPINKLSINSPNDLEFAIAGLNYRFVSMVKDPMIFSYLFGSSDDLSHNTGCYLFSTGSSGPSVSGASYPLYTYKPLYQTIASANDIFKKTASLNQNNTAIKHLLGEVHFIRAYSYFWLVRTYGQVPIIDNVDVNYTVKKPTFTEIYQFIEADLLKAINLLPNSNYDARIKYVTPHRGSAKALLAEVYLTMAGYPVKDTKMYANAAKMAGDVIDSANYFGFGLMPDLADLWNGKHQINHESVFSLYASGSLVDYYRNWSDTTYVPHTYLATDFYFFGQPISWSNSIVPGIKFYNSFPYSYRKEMTYLMNRYYIYTPQCVVDSINPKNKYCPPSEFIKYTYNTITYCDPMYFRKYYTKFELSDTDLLENNLNGAMNYNFVYKNFGTVVYLFRYAHTLLTYAEAKARMGAPDASAYAAINQVRRRANKVDMFSKSEYDLKEGLTSQQFADSVVWERALEFCAEPEGRWFDLLRLEMISKLKDLKDPKQDVIFPILNINENNYFLPFPKSDQMLDPNLN